LAAGEPKSRFSFANWIYRDFALLQLARVLVYTSMSMVGVAVGWQVYDLTGSALQLGWTGLAIFIPKLTFSLIGGDIADRFNRLRVLNLDLFLLTFAVAALWWYAKSPDITTPGIFALIALCSAIQSTGGPSQTSLLPQLVPPDKLSRAVAWGSSFWQASSIAGPAIGGLLYGATGKAHSVYGVAAISIGLGALCTLLVRPPATMPKPQGLMLQRLREGIRFVAQEKVILGAISLDLFAVLLGGAVALMPVYAKDVLGLGPEGLGMLRSAPALGAAVMATWLGVRPIRRHAGSKLFWGVLGFGVATCVFALSKTLWLSVTALFVLGASDMISVVIRHTLIQVRTPMHMRGRVSSVNQVFVGASNELGEFESGLTAHWFGVVPAVLAGGLGTIVVMLSWKKFFPTLFKTDSL
jgi:MFS family permease